MSNVAPGDSVDGLHEVELWQLELRFAALRLTSRERHRQLVSSLLEHGQQSPLLTVVGDEPNRYVLIDGYARVGALRELGRDTAAVIVLPLTDTAALAFGYRLHSGLRRTALEEGWLVRELVQARGKKLDEVAIELGHTRSWASRRLGLVRELPTHVQDLVRDGKLCPYTAMRSLLPLARANRAAETASAVDQIADVVVREALGSRQAQVLCQAWRAASSDQRASLLTSPRTYLKIDEALESTTAPTRRTPPSQPRLVRDFEVLVSVARRAEGILRGYGTGAGEIGESEALVLVWPRARKAFEALAQRVEARLDAGLGNEDGDLPIET